jgi:multiple sugar transport system permease protein
MAAYRNYTSELIMQIVEKLSRHNNRLRKDSILPYLLILPMVLIVLALVYYPVSKTIFTSFQAMDFTKPMDTGFVLFKNYKDLLADQSIWRSLTNSLFVLAFVLIGTIVMGIFVSLVLQREAKIKGLLMAVVILPWALPPIVNGLLWRGVFHPQFGIVNKLLLDLNIIHTGIQWLSKPYLVLTICSMVVMWRTVPLAAMIFLSALTSIPSEIYESAQMDGCNSVSAFRCITLPLLRPTIAIVLTLTTFTGVNLFDEVVSLTGFSGQTRTLLIEAYLRLFKFLNFGQGSAFIALIMLILVVPTFFYIHYLTSQD